MSESNMDSSTETADQSKRGWEYGEIALGQSALFLLLLLTCYDLVMSGLGKIEPKSTHAIAWWACWVLGFVYCQWVCWGGFVRGDKGSFILGLAGFVGAIVAAAGLGKYYAQPKVLAVCFTIGGAAILINYVYLFGRQLSFRVKAVLNVANAIFFAIILVFFANMVSAKHYRRFNVTGSDIYSIDEFTIETLEELKEPVTFHILMTRENELFEYMYELMERFQKCNSLVNVEYVDVDLSPAKAKERLREFGVGQSEVRLGVVVVQLGDKGTKYVTSSELAKIGVDRQGKVVRVDEFSAERVLIATLRGLTRGYKPRVLFLAGHGEKQIRSSDPANSYLTIVTQLQRENMEVGTYSAATESRPPDCDVLVVAGPQRVVPEREIALIEKFVENGGRLVLMLDPVINKAGDDLVRTGLESIAVTLGVKPNRAIVTMLRKVAAGVAILGGKRWPLQAVDFFRNNPITSQYHGSNDSIYFPSVRPLSLASVQEGEHLSISKLIAAPAECWGETSIPSYTSRKVKNDDADRRGQLVLAVAVEESASSTPSSTLAATSTPRAVIIGDSDFATDKYLSMGGANFEIFINSITWLTRKAGDEESNIIPPKAPPKLHLNIPMNKYKRVMYPVLFGLPLLCIAFGIVVWIVRRS